MSQLKSSKIVRCGLGYLGGGAHTTTISWLLTCHFSQTHCQASKNHASLIASLSNACKKCDVSTLEHITMWHSTKYASKQHIIYLLNVRNWEFRNWDRQSSEGLFELSSLSNQDITTYRLVWKFLVQAPNHNIQAAQFRGVLF